MTDARWRSDRVILRRFTESDAPLLFALDSDPEVVRFVGQLPPTSIEPYRAAICDRFLPAYARAPDLGVFAAIERASDRFIGWFHLRPALEYAFAAAAGYRAGDLDLGFRLVRSAWGRGYATEMSRVLVARALGELRAPRVVACALTANAASIRVLEKVGLARTAEVRLPGFDSPAIVLATRGAQP